MSKITKKKKVPNKRLKAAFCFRFGKQMPCLDSTVHFVQICHHFNAHNVHNSHKISSKITTALPAISEPWSARSSSVFRGRTHTSCSENLLKHRKRIPLENKGSGIMCLFFFFILPWSGASVCLFISLHCEKPKACPLEVSIITLATTSTFPPLAFPLRSWLTTAVSNVEPGANCYSRDDKHVVGVIRLTHELTS